MNALPRLLGSVLAGTLAAAVFAQPVITPPATAPVTTTERNTRHALIIGIGEYLDPSVPSLKGIRHDMVSARRMAAAMAVPESQTRMLRDHEATAERIRSEIAALHGRMNDGDRVFVYYSGHGTRTADASGTPGACTEGLMASDGQVLSNVELGQRLAPLAQRADKMLVFYDACFSGGIAGAPLRTRSFQIGDDLVTPKFTRVGAPAQCAQPSNFRTRSLAAALRQNLAPPQNLVHVAASRPDEVSFDSSNQGGFATVAWRECLLGQARDLDGSGAITVDEVTQCAQSKLSLALASQPGALGQQMTVVGNASFVPAWMSAAFTPGATSAAAAALPLRLASPAQVLEELHGQRDGNRRVVATLRKPRLQIGVDTLQIDVTPARDGHLYIALAGSDGKSLYLLYPNELVTDNRVRAGQRLALPGKGWEVLAAGPEGTETLLVMVTDAPRELRGLAQENSGPFMRTLLDGEGRSRLQSVFGNGTPASGCGKPGAASCSDAFGAALLRVQAVP